MTFGLETFRLNPKSVCRRDTSGVPERRWILELVLFINKPLRVHVDVFVDDTVLFPLSKSNKNLLLNETALMTC